MALHNYTVVVTFFILSLAVLAQPQPPAPPLSPQASSLSDTTLPVSGLVQGYELKAGWNTLSFPFSRVTGIKDLGLLIDPSTRESLSPLQSQPGKAYWTYVSSNSQGWAWGENQDINYTLPIKQGWNLIGSPLSQPLPLSQITISDDQHSNRIWDEICSIWIDPKMVLNGQIQTLDANTQLQPGAAYWLFARQPMYLHINSDDHVPMIRNLTGNIGHEIILEGSQFGSKEQGRILLGKQEIPNASILEWSDRRIRFQSPASASSSFITLVGNGAVAARTRLGTNINTLNYWIAPPGTRIPYTLKVVSQDYQAIFQAQVWIDDKYAGQTDRYGLIYIKELDLGTHKVRVRCRDFSPLDLSWKIIGNSSHPTAILYGPPSSISIRVMDAQDGFRIYKVDAYAVNDYSQRYTKYYSYNQASPYIDIFWPNITGNIKYRFDLTWRNDNAQEKYQTIYRTPGRYGITETWWNYWTQY